MRLFIAINFPDEIKATVAEIRNGLKEAALRGNFSSDENLHLTLVFLGECDFQQMKAVKAVMGDLLFPTFTLMLDKIGYFKRDGGHTWWIGLKDSKSLSDLQANLSECLRQNGFMLENRSFAPHITVGREVKMQPEYVQPKVQQVGFHVTSIELMKSERINGKLTYTPVYSKMLSIER